MVSTTHHRHDWQVGLASGAHESASELSGASTGFEVSGHMYHIHVY